MKKVLILGVSGMLGSVVLDFISTKDDIKLVGTLRQKKLVDKYKKRYKNVKFIVSSPDNTPLKKIDYIINCIGVIKQKSNDPHEMLLINSVLPYSIYDKADTAKIIQPATDCVFSGKKGLYTEKDEHDTLDVYGKTKSLGEVNGKNFYNIRTSIIGPEAKSKVSLLEWFLSQKKNTTVEGYANHYWNGITTLHFAKLCYAVISKDIKLPNLIHFVPDDSVNKYQLLKLFSKTFGRPDIIIQKSKAEAKINRTLDTIYKNTNKELWKEMGYNNPPSIDLMIQELADYVKERNFYNWKVYSSNSA
jgi:dTDP-4-dehydrorhamnose reductase